MFRIDFHVISNFIYNIDGIPSVLLEPLSLMKKESVKCYLLFVICNKNNIVVALMLMSG